MSERRTQIKLTSTPSARRAIPAVIAAATDDGPESHVAPEEPGKSNGAMNAEFALLAQATGDVVIALDRALRFTFANHAAESLFGRSADTLRGRPFATLAPDTAKSEDSALLTHLRAALRSGENQKFDLQFDTTGKRYDGFVIPYSDGLLVSLRDTTERYNELDDLQESHRIVEQIIELAPETIYIHDIVLGAYVYSNKNVAVSLGYSPEEMDALSPADVTALTVAEDRLVRDDCRKALVDRDTVIECDYRMLHKNGSVRWMHTRETVFGRDADGKPRLILGFAQDVTERKLMMETLRQREEHLERLTESSPDCILTLDLKGGLIEINQSGKALMEIADFAPLVGAEWLLLFQENYRPLARQALSTALAGGTERFQGVAKTAGGTPLWWDVVVTPIPGSDRKPAQILTVSRDITGFKALESERERLLQEAITRADYDALTGLLNNRAFHRHLETMARVQEGGKLPSFTILLLDLENFRYFNDAYGRATGDDLLIRMAKELTKCCRNSDTLARVGPDEYGILAPDLRAEEIGPYVLRLRAAIDSIGMRSPDGAEVIPLHIAVGYALFPNDTASVNAAYDIAEERQRADSTGGNSREAERVRATLRDTVDSFSMLDTLIATIDAKDRMTRRQSEDTLIYSRRIADRFGLTEEQKRSLEIAALLHDVGKVGIDERILRQPGKLSDEDFAVVQQHPKISAMLVGSTVDDVDAVEAILYHHENWNGSGYPAGIAGEEIPLLARILNVASSYAAMTNNRPYRKGMTPHAAQKVLQNGAGTQWDPDCVTALLGVANG